MYGSHNVSNGSTCLFRHCCSLLYIVQWLIVHTTILVSSTSLYFQLAYVCIGLNVYRSCTVSTFLKKFKEFPKQHIAFEWPGSWQMAFNNIVAIFLFMVWVKLFKYINLSKTLGQLGYTLIRVTKLIT